MNVQNYKEITYNKVLGARIKAIRKSLGYKSYADLNIQGLNNYTFSYIERGDRDVRLSSLLSICGKFGIELSELLSGVEQEIEFQRKISEKIKNQ